MNLTRQIFVLIKGYVIPSNSNTLGPSSTIDIRRGRVISISDNEVSLSVAMDRLRVEGDVVDEYELRVETLHPVLPSPAPTLSIFSSKVISYRSEGRILRTRSRASLKAVLSKWV